jgi:hypothetical protein
MFGHSASLHEAGALPNSLSPETAKGTRGDDLIVAPLARSLMVNIAHLRKLNEAYTGRTAWVALADRRGRRHRPGCGFIVGGCGRPRNSGALSGPRRGGPCRRMRGVLYDRHFSHRVEPSKSPRLRTQRERKTIEYIFSSRVGACQRG